MRWRRWVSVGAVRACGRGHIGGWVAGVSVEGCGVVCVGGAAPSG